VTSHLSMCAVMTVGYVCEKDTSLILASMKVRGIWDHLVHVIGPSTTMWLTL
jgi:hypothetical protein